MAINCRPGPRTKSGGAHCRPGTGQAFSQRRAARSRPLSAPANDDPFIKRYRGSRGAHKKEKSHCHTLATHKRREHQRLVGAVILFDIYVRRVLIETPHQATISRIKSPAAGFLLIRVVIHTSTAQARPKDCHHFDNTHATD